MEENQKEESLKTETIENMEAVKAAKSRETAENKEPEEKAEKKRKRKKGENRKKREKAEETESPNTVEKVNANETIEFKETEEKKDGDAAEGEKESAVEDGEIRKKSIKKRIIIASALAFALLVIAAASFVYYKGMVYYRTHFFPNTTINGFDCSMMEVESIVTSLDASIYEYKLIVTGRNYKTGDSGAVLGEILPEDIQLAYSGTEEAVRALLEQQEEYRWIFCYFGEGASYGIERSVSFDEEMLKSTMGGWDASKKANMRKAENAYISDYSEEIHGYEIIPETAGTELDMNKALQLTAEAIVRQEDILDLEEQECYAEAAVRQDDKKLTSVVNTANNWLSTKITYDWNGTEVLLDYETLKDWVSIEENKAVLDEEQVAEFVKTQASAYDTYGKKKNFTTTLGVELTLNSRNYGWKTDTASETEELLQLIYQGSTVDREPVYSITAMKKGADDIGDSYVEADLTHQHLYLYSGGEIVLESDFVSGTMISTYDCVTPEGIYGLLYKTTNAVLRGATYETPVNYWMPFYGNYGMHDAYWRGSFGGEIYKTNGSHGCINLPPSMAAQIYTYVSTGFPVICYYYDGAPYVGPPTVPAEPIDESAVPEESNGEESNGEG